jgi:nitrite reductase/ring-hydroxylating ferredoxin subunit
VPEECAVECPLHGGLFNIKTGHACGEPATRPVRIYKTVIQKGEAYVNLE